MNCKEFKNKLSELAENYPEFSLTTQMKQHLSACAECKADYETTIKLLASLKPAASYSSSKSGLKQNILNQIKMEELKMKTQKEKFRLKTWHKRSLAIAASLLLMFAVFMLSNRNPFFNNARAAENLMMKSITAMESLKSMFMTMDVRSQENEPFDFIGTEYSFIEYKFWKQFSGEKPWRIEKPGRIVVFDGEKQYLYMPASAYAVTAGEGAGFVEWIKLFLSPKDILENELNFSKTHKAVYKIEESGDEIILTVNANALGDFHNNYLKNNSVLESDNSRVYVFDKKTYLLKTFNLFIDEYGKSFQAMNLKNIAYNIPIDSGTFIIDLPKGISWQEHTEPGHINAFTNISSKQAAKKFFTALANEDYESIEKVFSLLQIEDAEKLNEIKEDLGGLELISLGEPFKSGLFPGEFVPYKIRLKSGEVKDFNLALRNDNPTKTWIIDGGI